MTHTKDVTPVKTGVVLYRRTDVRHKNWCCRIRVPNDTRYKRFTLNTTDINTARDQALELDAEIRLKSKNDLPVFEISFAQVAKEFSNFQKIRSEAGEITNHRWRVIHSHIRTQLNRYVGNIPISKIGQAKWIEYPSWRHKNGKGISGGRVSDGTVRDEMTTFRAVMKFAASKHYIREHQVFTGRLKIATAKREEFSDAEYSQLLEFMPGWVEEARNAEKRWVRTVVRFFVKIMCDTGMRPTEARSLKWQDIELFDDPKLGKLVHLNVRGKSKKRKFPAKVEVWTYLMKIREISKATRPQDFIFSTYSGKPSATLYNQTVSTLLDQAGILTSSSGKRRSTYCFRHTFATKLLSLGVSVYDLAIYMDTSVAMIEQHYGHVTPISNADKVLVNRPLASGLSIPTLEPFLAD